MPQTSVRFRINQPDVVAENFGEEIVAIHLKRGNYYSIEESGTTIWQLAATGATVEEIIADIRQAYRGDSSDIQKNVYRFLEELQQAELIIAADDGHADPVPSSAKPQTTARKPFVPPTLNEYTDMQELLLLDPIHDVAEGGWPLQKAL